MSPHRRVVERLAMIGLSLVACFFAASAATAALGTTLFDVPALERETDAPAEPSSLARPEAKQGSADKSEVLAAIVEHNPFCRSCVDEAPTQSAQSSGIVETKLPLTLVATMVASEPAGSLATISTPHGVGAFGVGEPILAGVHLAAVGTGRVQLNNAGALEELRVRTEAAKPKKRRKSSKKKTKRRKHEIAGARDSISCRKLQCTVEREFVDRLVARPGLLRNQGRARPFQRPGLRGFRLSRIRRGTLLQLLGLKNGDVITAVNGKRLTTMDGAMAMYTRLRSSRSLSVEFTRSRRGKRRQMQLDVEIN